jgi:hypothetical protein
MKFWKYVIGVAGVALLISAFFAQQLGLDHNSDWGWQRVVMLGMGLIFVGVSVVEFVSPSALANIAQSCKRALEKSGALDYSVQLNVFSLLAIVIVSAVYFWFFVPFIHASPTTDNYTRLATSFKNHHLYLPEQPPAALLSLNNPYNWGERYSIRRTFTMDVSLYNGRFYLYWGPVPSLLLTVFSEEQLQKMGDQHVFFAFLYGLFLYSVLLVRSFWKKVNLSLPAWMIGVALLAIGLTGPSVKMLNLMQIYEAAIAGCQFFFIGGIYWAYSALQTKPMSAWKIALASLHWALAIGTRVTVAPAVGFLVLLVLFQLWQECKLHARLMRSLSAVLVPLLVLATSLGWYNYARFGSVTEFGLRYQLAQVDYNEFTKVFSADYLSENFHNYFLRPFATQPKFPFLQAVEIIYSNERMTGLLYTTPLFLVVLIALGRLLFSKSILQKIREFFQNGMSAESWLALGLTGSSLIVMAVVLLYYYPAIRFSDEFLPSLMLLAVMSLWSGVDIFAGNVILRRTYLALVTAVVLYSITVSILLAIPFDRTREALLLIKPLQQLFGFR